MRALEASGADAAGGAVRTEAGGPGLVARAIALAQRSPFGVGDAGYRYAATARAVDTVNYRRHRREVFARIRVDDSMQWVEDDELNYRLRALGGPLLPDPAIGVEYAAREELLAALWWQRYRWGFNKPRVAERHPGQCGRAMLRRPCSRSRSPGHWRRRRGAGDGGWLLAALAAAYAAGSPQLAELRLAQRYGFSAERCLRWPPS